MVPAREPEEGETAEDVKAEQEEEQERINECMSLPGQAYSVGRIEGCQVIQWADFIQLFH